jgi:hypothetical protein
VGGWVGRCLAGRSGTNYFLPIDTTVVLLLQTHAVPIK